MARIALALAAAAYLAVAAVAGGPIISSTNGETVRSTAADGTLLATIDGATLTVVAEPNPVPRGEKITLEARIGNGRREDVDYQPARCGFAFGHVWVPIPWEPVGRTWTGRAAWFKDFILKYAYGAGAGAAWSPIDADLRPKPCDKSGSDARILGPRQVLTEDFSHALREILDRYPHAGTVAFSVSANIDRQNEPPTIEPGSSGIPPRDMPVYRDLSVQGEISIEGEPQDLLTAGEAVDVLLGQAEFVSWLNAQPEGTCQAANLTFDSAPGTSEGHVWYIQLMCESGVPRHDGVGLVDAETGRIVRLDFPEPDA